MNIWVISSLEESWWKLKGTLFYKYFCGHRFSFWIVMGRITKECNFRVIGRYMLRFIKQFSKMAVPLYISISSVWASQVFHILTNIWHYSSFKIFINSSEVKSYCGLIWVFLIIDDYSYIVFCLLASVTSDENLAIILTIVPLHYHFFSLWQLLSFIFISWIFSHFIMIRLILFFLCVYPALHSLSFLDQWIFVFHQIWGSSNMSLPNFLSALLLRF